MDSRFLLSVLKNKLLMPVYMVLIIAGALQLLVNQGLIRLKADDLANLVESKLTASTDTTAKDLKAAEAQLLNQLHLMRQNTATELSGQLQSQLAERQEQIAVKTKQVAIQQTQSLAEVIGLVGAPFIWDQDVPRLTQLVEMADARPSILFAVFFDQYGKRITRYVDRTDPVVKDLIKQGKGKGGLGKVLNAAEADPDIVVITSNISPKGEVIGQFKVGLSTTAIKEEMARLESQFGATIQASTDAVDRVLNTTTSDVAGQLKASLGQIEQRANTQNDQVLASIESRVDDLEQSLVSLSLVSVLLLLFAVAIILGIRVVMKVERLNRAIWAIAEGKADLTQRVQLKGKDEISHMAAGMNQFIERIQHIVKDVHQSTALATSQSEEQKRASEIVANAVKLQQTEIRQVAGALDEMTGSAQKVADRIQAVANTVDNVNRETVETAEISRLARTSLESMVKEIDTATGVVEQVNGHSQEIGSVLTVIGNIAEQTNLLALNAAIEAARAGESGRGFAVVADEVRSLASKTQQSTTEIQSIIERLQKGSMQAVQAIQRAGDSVDESTGSFHKADTRFETIGTLVADLHDAATEIAAAAEQQTVVANQINDNVGHIEKSADQTAEAVLSSDQSSQEINKVIRHLEQQMAQFRF